MFDIFGMTGEPFLIPVKRDEAFAFEDYKEGMERLEWVRRIQGVGAVVGQSGCGKSTLLRHFLDGLSPEHTKAIALHTTTGSPRDLLAYIAHCLGVEASTIRSRAVRAITRACHDLLERKIQPLLVVDEAHYLSHQSLHELRLLMTSVLDREQYFIVIFSGQPEWEQRLHFTALAPLQGRITTWIRFRPLPPEEVEPYLQHRLALVGVPHNLFSPPAIAALAQRANGILRTLNVLAHHALLACAQAKETTVTAEHVRLACEEVGA